MVPFCVPWIDKRRITQMWRSSRVLLKQILSSALRYETAKPPPSGLTVCWKDCGSLFSSSSSSLILSTLSFSVRSSSIVAAQGSGGGGSTGSGGGRSGCACGGSVVGERDEITSAEAKKLMRLVNVVELKIKLGMEGKEVIRYSDLLEACESMGVTRSLEEATAFARVLDEAGVVLLFRDKVYLHPDKVILISLSFFIPNLELVSDTMRSTLSRFSGSLRLQEVELLL